MRQLRGEREREKPHGYLSQRPAVSFKYFLSASFLFPDLPLSPLFHLAISAAFALKQLIASKVINRILTCRQSRK